jgi:membrane protein
MMAQLITFKTLLIMAGKDYHRDNCATLAAAIAYYSFFSIFPLMLLLLSIVGTFLSDQHLKDQVIISIISMIPSASPSDTNTLVNTLNEVASGAGGVVNFVGIALLAWSASKISAIVRTSLNIAYNLETFRPFIRQKLVDLGTVFGIGIFLFLSILCTALFQTVRQLTQEWLLWVPWSGIFIGDSGLFWSIASLLIPLSLSFFAFSVVYSMLPAIRLPLKYVWPAALVATFLFEIVKNGFAFYLIHFSNYDIVFGSLGAVIAFLVWTYLSASVLLFGAELASDYSKITLSDRIP